MPVIAHLSDPHLDTSQPHFDRLAAVLQQCAELPELDAVVVTGDLADHGSAQEYEQLFTALLTQVPRCSCRATTTSADPLRAALGSHGPVTELNGTVPELNAALRLPGVHLTGLDSHLDGHDEGVLGVAALEYARAELATGDEPVILAMHHPPVPVGHSTMDRFGLQDPSDVAALVQGSDRVVGVFTGHVHTALATTFAGVPLAGAPGIVSTMRLGSRTDPIADPDAMPGLAIHTLEGRCLRTVFHHLSLTAL